MKQHRYWPDGVIRAPEGEGYVAALKKPSSNRLALRKGRESDPLPDLPSEAPDWGNEIDESLSISDGPHQRIKVLRAREMVPWERKVAIFAAHRFACLYCGQVGALVIDHIVPVASGGSARDENLAPACDPCNKRKKAKPLTVWLASEPDMDVEGILRRWREAQRGAELRISA